MWFGGPTIPPLNKRRVAPKSAPTPRNAREDLSSALGISFFADARLLPGFLAARSLGSMIFPRDLQCFAHTFLMLGHSLVLRAWIPVNEMSRKWYNIFPGPTGTGTSATTLVIGHLDHCLDIACLVIGHYWLVIPGPIWHRLCQVGIWHLVFASDLSPFALHKTRDYRRSGSFYRFLKMPR